MDKEAEKFLAELEKFPKVLEAAMAVFAVVVAEQFSRLLFEDGATP